jgi:uncharacterized membrane protein
MPKSDGMVTVVVEFDDVLRAKQAAYATGVWRTANPTLPVGPITVVKKTASGAVGVETSGVVRPRAGARTGFLIGALVAALPAAGIGGFVGWLLGALITALLTLTGLIPDSAATPITLAVGVGFAVLSAILVGLVGGLIGMGVGALVGWLESRSAGLTDDDIGPVAAELRPNDAMVVVKVSPPTAPLVTEELSRLGGSPREAPPRQISAAAKPNVAGG